MLLINFLFFCCIWYTILLGYKVAKVSINKEKGHNYEEKKYVYIICDVAIGNVITVCWMRKEKKR